MIRFEPDVIAIAGSYGKTRAKEIIKRVLEVEFKVRANPRSYNTEIGLPLAVLHLPSGNSSMWRWFVILAKGTLEVLTAVDFPSKLVLELGTDSPGDMDYLLSMVRPKVLVITGIEGAHLGHFEDIEQAASEVEKAVRALGSDDFLILNADDKWSMHMRQHAKCGVRLFGRSPKSDVIARRVRKSGNFLKVLVEYKVVGQKHLREYKVPGTTDQHLYGLLAAISVGESYGIGLTEAAKLIVKES